MAQAKAKKSDSSSKKIVDVKSDGDGAVGNSRAIIVNNRPILKDPMMAEVSKLTGGGSTEPEDKPAGKANDQADDDGSERVVVRRENKIQPIDADTEPAAETPEDKPADETEPADAKEEVVPEQAADAPGAPDVPADEPKQEPEEPVEPEAEVETTEPSSEAEPESKDEPDEKPSEGDKLEEPEQTNDALDDAETSKEAGAPSGAQAGRSFDDTKPGQAETADAETDAKGKKESEKPDYGQLNSDQQKAVETGEYFLPIQTAEGRRVRREILAAAFFVLILIVAWVDIMLDAGLIKIDGVRALTNFFN